MNIKFIITGWLKALFGISSDLSKKRLAICAECPMARTSRFLEIINGKAHHTNGLQCMACSCPCLEKSLVKDEVCPLGKW